MTELLSPAEQAAVASLDPATIFAALLKLDWTYHGITRHLQRWSKEETRVNAPTLSNTFDEETKIDTLTRLVYSVAYQEGLSTFETIALLSGGVLPWAGGEIGTKSTDAQYIKYLLDQAQPKTLTPKEWAALTANVEALGNNTIAQFLFTNGWYQDGISINHYQYIESETAAVRVPTGDRTFAEVGVCPIEFIQRVAKAFGVSTDEMVEMIQAKTLVAAA
jgi:hypothetical protein